MLGLVRVIATSLLLQQCLLSLHLWSPITAAATPQYDPATCPPWLAKYKKFHDENKGLPNTRYLSMWCTEKIRCAGLGDRLRGIMFALRAAYVYNMVLLINIDQPLPLEFFLGPNQIDWSIHRGLPANFSWDNPDKFSSIWDAIENQGPVSQADFVQKMTNSKLIRDVIEVYYDRPFPGANKTDVVPNGDWRIGTHFDIDPHTYVLNGTCLFHFLFKINSTLWDIADRRTVDMFGRRDAEYLGWHWRTGGQLGEEGRVNLGPTVSLYSRLAQLMAGHRCLKEMASQFNMSTTGNGSYVMLATDLNPMRKYVSEGNVVGLVTTNESAVNILQGHLKLRDEDYLPVFVDMLMLSRAKCAVLSHSGFSFTAAILGGLNCFTSLAHCIEMQASSFLGIKV